MTASSMKVSRGATQIAGPDPIVARDRRFVSTHALTRARRHVVCARAGINASPGAREGS
jgi:hypothetical protein